MVVRREKRCRKKRGLHTYHGAKKKARGGGSRGGRGNCGMQKHKKSWMILNDPEHFGRRGFKIPQKIKRVTEVNSINIRDIELLSIKLGLKEIDLSKFGFQKVLSGGRLTKPLIIKAQKFSARAKESIEEAGGKVVEG